MSDSELEDLVFEEAADKMKAAVTHARQEFAKVRTGRADPRLIEKLPVEYYGADVPLQQLASFSVPEARLLVITPFDKSSMTAVERAIQQSDLGLNPSNDGTVLRLSFPPLTEERRRDLVRIVKQMAEDGRIAVRNARRAGRQELEALEKDGELSEDDLTRAEKRLDQMTRSAEDQIDAALAAKEEELLAV